MLCCAGLWSTSCCVFHEGSCAHVAANWQTNSAVSSHKVRRRLMTCQAYARAVPCSQCQIPKETLFAYEPYCCLECEAEPSMTGPHREHPGYAKTSPCCSTDLHSDRSFYKIHTVMLPRSSEMARTEERASILFDLKGDSSEAPYAVDHNARGVQTCEEFKHARSRVLDSRRVMLQLSVKSWHRQ